MTLIIAERDQSMDAITSSPLERDIVNIKMAVKSVINAIQNYDGPVEELKKLNELGRVQISRLRELIDNLDTFVHEQTDDVLKARLKSTVQSEKEQLQSAVKDFQKANIESMLSVERKNHAELFAMSNPEEVLRRRNNRNHSSLLHQNADITDHMSVVSRQLADVVSQNASTLETLVKSSTNITGIRDELRNTGSIIDQSGKILNKYEQREATDKVVISLAFAFFLVCVAYVFYSRL